MAALNRLGTRLFSTAISGGRRRPVALFINAARLDYDNKLDFSRIASLCDFRRHDTDYVRNQDEMVALVEESQAEIVITKEMQVPAEAFRRFPSSVKLLCEAGTGFNNLPVLAARERNVPVCNCPTYSTDAVAHMAITYLMNFSVSMFDQQRMLWQDNRANFTGPFTLPLSEINGKTLGLVGGAGRIGTTVAEIGLALGMNIIISSRRPTLPDGHSLSNNPRVTVCTSDNLGFLLSRSDYVSLHTPLNDQTRGTFGREQIAQMKPTAFLINTSRGVSLWQCVVVWSARGKRRSAIQIQTGRYLTCIAAV
jgi:glycerate dehydrogenase